MLPDFERADRLGEFWSYPQSRTFAELLIDCERTGRSERCSSGCCGSLTELPLFTGRAPDGNAGREPIV